MYISGVDACFCVVTPNCRTSSGSRLWAWLTRFSTRTAAVSGSISGRKVATTCRLPSEAATDFMYIRPSTPLMASSSGTATDSATSLGLAPG